MLGLPIETSDVIENRNVIWNYKLHDHVIELPITNYIKIKCNWITNYSCNL